MKMNYDDLLRKVSGKRFEKRMFLLFFLNGLPNVFLVTTLALILYTPGGYWCKVPDEAMTHFTQNSSSTEKLLDYLIPPEKENGTRSKCFQYNRTTNDVSAFLDFLQNDTLPRADSFENVTSVPCDNGYQVMNPYNVHSAGIEFDLFCEKAKIKPIIYFVFYMGICVGSASGFFSDRFGRRPIFISFTFMGFLTMFLESFTHTTLTFSVVLFFAGLTSLVNYVTGFVLGTELTTPEKRNFISISSFFSFPIGYGISTLIFYLCPNWRWFLRVIGMLSILYIPNIWFTPESPRWLMATGRIEEAKKVLKMIGKTNKKSDALIEEVMKDVQQVAEGLMAEKKKNKSKDSANKKRKLLVKMVTTPRLFMIIVSCAFAWFSATIVYYGISLSVQSLSGDIYINNTLMGLVELPGVVMAFLAVKYMNRSRSHGAMMIGSGIFCMGAALLSKDRPQAATIVGLAGKSLNAGAFYLVYIHTAEVFPTLIRNSTMSFGSFCGRVGSLVTPYLLYLVELHGIYTPYIIMSCFSVASGFCTLLFLPDTQNRGLPETTEDILKLKSGYTICCKTEKTKSEVNIEDNTESLLESKYQQ